MELRKRLRMSSLVLGAAITGILAGTVMTTGCGKSAEANGCGGPNGCGGQNGCNGPNGCNGHGAESRKAEAPKK